MVPSKSHEGVQTRGSACPWALIESGQVLVKRTTNRSPGFAVKETLADLRAPA